MDTRSKYDSIIFMGKTGCGKGTQARNLNHIIGYKVFSTGDRVREIAAESTPLGRTIQKIHVSGWVPEWLASYLMVKTLLEEHLEEGLIFESVARKPEEAKKLDEIHQMLSRSYVVIHLDIDDAIAIERMRKRQRDVSDSEENIKKRLAAYETETVQSLAFFRQQGKVVTIDANRAEQDVLSDIVAAIQS